MKTISQSYIFILQIEQLRFGSLNRGLCLFLNENILMELKEPLIRSLKAGFLTPFLQIISYRTLTKDKTL